MVSHKTHESKTRRCTYAERTVTAISDIRKRHPRRLIHHNTLKAQVKKNAEAQNDLLGPRWIAFVDAACRTLMSQGILDPHHPPGHVVLTSYGKRLIESTRRSIGVPGNHEHNPECREGLGRKVLRRLSLPSQRGPRSFSLPASGAERDEQGPRTRMSMADLLEENRRLQSEYEELKSETSHKLAELTSQLESKEDELLEYQDKLSGFNDSEWEDANATLVHDESSEFVDDTAEADKTRDKDAPVLEMPTRSVDRRDSRISANVTSNSSLQRSIPISTNSLTRTQSGSLISAISKQPTPAPSDVDTESVPSSPMHSRMNIQDFSLVDDMTADMDTSFDPDMTLADSEDASMTEDQLRTPSATRTRVQMLTPMSSPQYELRRGANEAGAARKRVERLAYERDGKAAELQKKLDAKDATLKERDDKIRILESQLADRRRMEEDLRLLREHSIATEAQCKTLECEKEELQRMIDDLKNQLQDKSVEALNVQARLEEKEQEVEAYVLATETEKAHASDVSARLDRVRQELRESENTRDALQGQLGEALAETVSVRNELKDVTVGLKVGLEDARTREIALAREVKEKSDECEHLRAELRASDEQTHKAQSELLGLQEKFDNMSLVKERLELEVLAVKERNVELEKTVNALRGELTSVRKELEVEQTSARHLHESFREVVAQKEGLISELETNQAFFLEAQNVLKQKESELSIMRDDFSAALKAAGEHKSMAQVLQAKLQDGDVQKAHLSQALRDVEEELTDLKEGYEKLKEMTMSEFEEMDKRVTKKRKRESTPLRLSSPLLDTDVDVGFDYTTPMAI